MKLLPISEVDRYFLPELAQALFSKEISALSPEQIVCIQELLGKKPPRLTGNDTKDLASQLLWMLYKPRREGVTWNVLAKRAFLESTALWRLKNKIIDLWKGKEMPLFGWDIIHSISFAAVDNHPTPEFLLWWRSLRRLYEDAFEEYGSASKKIPTVRIAQLSPVRPKELAQIK